MGSFTSLGRRVNVASDPAGEQFFASADVLADGSTLIRWENYNGGPLTPAAARFDADGDRLGGAVAIAGQFASLAGGGGVALTSRQRSTAGDDKEFRAQLYDSAGAAIGEPVTVNTDRITSNIGAQIAALPGGGFVVTWDSRQSGPDQYGHDLRAQFFDADGRKVGGEIIASSVSSYNLHQSVVLADGSLVACWNTVPMGPSSDIRFTIIGADGAIVAADRTANTITAGGQYKPAISALANGGFVIGWVDSGDAMVPFWSDTTAARAQIFDATGTKIGGEITVSDDATPGKGDVAMLGLKEGGFVAAWQESDASEVRAQLYDDQGRPAAALGGMGVTYGDQNGNAIADIIETGPGTIAFVLRSDGGRETGGTGTDVEIVYWSATLESVITGTASDDTLRGTAGDNQVSALAGFDLIYGSAGRDGVDGGAGFDRLHFMLGDTSAFAAASGPRSFTVADGRVSGAGGAIETSFVNVELVRLDLRNTGDFGDTVDGSGYTMTPPTTRFEFLLGAGNDVVTGTAANDLIVGGLGRLTADGGAGNDYAVVYADFAQGEVLVRRAGERVVVTQGGAEIADLRLIERVQVSPPAATSSGTRVDAAGVDVSVTLFDTGGVDILTGGAGSDQFISYTLSDAGGQADRYTGGGGADVFDFLYAAKAMDGTTITDFGADDRIALDSDGPADALNLPIGSFIGRAQFSGEEKPEVRYTSAEGVTYLQVDGDGDGVADATLTLEGGAFALNMFADFSGPYVAIQSGVTVLNGTANADTLVGTAGDDEIGGLDGDDALEGGAGRDLLFGEDGDDRLRGDAGDDVLHGGDGDDVLDGGLDTDELYGGAGADRLLSTGAGFDFLSGGTGDDFIEITGGSGQAAGDEGDDTLVATGPASSFGPVLLFGGDGDDRLTVTNGGSTFYLHGDAGDDVIRASGSGDIQIYGGLGDDEIAVENYGSGYISTGPGRDLVRLPAGTFSVDNTYGADVVLPSLGTNNIRLFDFRAGEAGDRIDLSIYGADPFATGAVTIANESGAAVIRHAASDSMFRIEGVQARDLSTYNLGVANPLFAPRDLLVEDDAFESDDRTDEDFYEELVGGDGNDLIRGFDGVDFLLGGGGDDRLEGGSGDDQLDGGAGVDTAVFAGARSAYSMVRLVDGRVELTGPDGVDLVSEVERFGFDDGVYRAADKLLSASPVLGVRSFGASDAAGGWTSADRYPRALADVNGDGRADLVGFGAAGVYASLSQGDGRFGNVFLAQNSFGASDAGGGWTSADAYPRTLADVNGDGLADLIGFGAAGAYVSLAIGNGQFGAVTLAVQSFGTSAEAGGWTDASTYPRAAADINGDGRADLLGFGAAGVYAALSRADGSFGDVYLAQASFGASAEAGGWTSDDAYPRALADVNGDGMADLVGFGSAGVYVSLATGGGRFGEVRLAVQSFGASDAAGGWATEDRFPRMLADVNGDERADIVGFGAAGAYVALGREDGSFADPTLEVASFGTSDAAGGWASDDRFPRLLADVNGDGLADIVGFGNEGVYFSYATDLVLA